VGFWFSEDEFARLTLHEYEAKVELLTELGEPGFRRRRARQLLAKVAKLKERAPKVGLWLPGTEEWHNYITLEEKAPLFDDVAKFSARVDTALKAIEEAPKSKESVLNFGRAKWYVTHESRVMALLGNAKRPQSKPREPKPEEKNRGAKPAGDLTLEKGNRPKIWEALGWRTETQRKSGEGGDGYEKPSEDAGSPGSKKRN
jgi:hypothetical protein